MTPEQLAVEHRQFLIRTEKQSAVLLAAEFGRMKLEITEFLAKGSTVRDVPNLYVAGYLERILLFLDNQVQRISIPFSAIVSRAQRLLINFTGSSLKRYLPEISASIFEPDKEAIRILIGRTRGGVSLGKYFSKMRPLIAEKAKAALIEGFALGEGNAAIAKRLNDIADIGHYRAMTIARTETNESYRAAGRNFYQSAGIKKYIWKSIRDGRTCLICWSLHNRIFPSAKKVFSHPNCRCVILPFRGERLESSEKTFAELERGVQKDILGKQRFELYESGKFGLKDFTESKDDKEFGRTFRAVNLAGLEKR